MGLAEAVRLAARVLNAERKREQAALDRSAGGASEFRGIGMEIATVAVEGAGQGRPGRASAYMYNDAEVEKVLIALGRPDGDGKAELEERGDSEEGEGRDGGDDTTVDPGGEGGGEEGR